MTLKEILKKKHIPQYQLAERSGVKMTTLEHMLDSNVPKERETWIKVRKCLKKDFGIEYVGDEWKSTGEMTVAPQKMKSRGLGLAPQDIKTKLAGETELVSKLLTESIEAYHMPRVKNDQELAERFDQYFNMCASRGQVPTVEEMCMYTGYSYDWVWRVDNGIMKGFTNETSKIIRQAKEMLKMFDAKLVVAGKLNFLTYCFRAKNYYGLVDKQEYVVTPNQKPENNFDAEDIRKRYAVETTFEDDAK